MLVVWLLHLLALLAFIAIRRHAKSEQLRPEWDLLLTPRGRQVLDAIEEEVEVDAKLLNDAFRRAVKSRIEGNGGEAVRFLKLACSVVEWTLPQKLDRLRAMRRISRMAAALLPGPPLQSHEFRSTPLVILAVLARWLHYMLATSAQRFRLRLLVLAEGFRIALSRMRRSVRDVERRRHTLMNAWDDFAAASDDFKSLDRRHLEAVRTLLEGQVAYQRARTLAEALRTH